MTDAQFAAYEAYIRQLAQAFLIGDWQITLERSYSDNDSRAEVTLHRQKQQACVWLNRDFFTYPRLQQRCTLVHELLHVQTERMCRAMTQLAEQLAESELVRYANQRLDEEEEIMIDRLARAVAPLLPLPPEVMT